jgi:hypothetical protein
VARRSVVVEFTPQQLDATITALAYCTAGSPADVGMEDNAQGFKVQTAMNLVLDNLIAIRDSAG